MTSHSRERLENVEAGAEGLAVAGDPGDGDSALQCSRGVAVGDKTGCVSHLAVR